jgi:hypothetical protein
MKMQAEQALKHSPGSNPSHKGINFMARAASVLSTPPANTSSPQPCQPPPLIPGGQRWGHLPYLSARKAGHPLAHLMRLREQAAEQIDALLDFLDRTEGDVDLDYDGFDDREPDLTGYSAGMDSREGDPADDEPSLGWTIAGAIGGDSDLEAEVAA